MFEFLSHNTQWKLREFEIFGIVSEENVLRPETPVNDAFVMETFEKQDDSHGELLNMVVVELLRVLLHEIVEAAIIEFLAENNQLQAIASNAFGEDKFLR